MGGTLPPAAAPTALEETNVARSVFKLPASSKEGRDPFFPNSTRPYEVALATGRAPGLLLVTCKGISGTPDHRFAIINNHTFATGDEGEVVVPGGKVHIRCVEIKTNSVVVEAGGDREELPIRETK